MWPYSWTHVGTPSHLGHMDRVAATMPSQAHAGAAQEAPNIGQWEGQDVPLVRPSSCTVKGGIPSSRRYLPTYLTMGQFSNSFPKHFSYLCEYAIRFDLSCSFCEYPFIFHCLHCSPSCFDPDSLLLAYLWLGLSWIECISATKTFSSSKTSSRKPYTCSKQQKRHKHSVETTKKPSGSRRQTVSAYRQQPRAVQPVRRDQSHIYRRANEDGYKERGYRREDIA